MVSERITAPERAHDAYHSWFILASVDDPYLPYCDVYALCAERSLRLARELLDGWAPKREWSAAEIAIPIGGDRMFHSDEDALAWLIEHPTAEQTLYWRSRRDD